VISNDLYIRPHYKEERMLRFGGLVFLSAAFFLVFGIRAETILDGYGMIGGVVMDSVSQDSLEGVEVAAYIPGTTIVIDDDITDSQGRYTLLIPMYDQEEDTVVVYAEEYSYIPKDTTVVVGFLEVDSLDFSLVQEAQPIRGTITSLESPFARIESVYVWAEVQGDTIGSHSDENGVYVLRLYYPGDYTITFSHPDFADVAVDTSIAIAPGNVYLHVGMEQVVWNVSIDGDDDTGLGTRYSPLESIKKALDYATTDDTVLVWPGIYTGGGNTEININNFQVTIRSADGPESTFIECSGYPTQERAFSFTNVGPLMVVDGFTIKHGYNSLGGAIDCFQSGSPTLLNLVLRENRAFQYGGALSIDDDSHPVIANSVFEDNEAAHGGAISVRGECTATLDSCIVINNEALTGNGGGIYLRDSHAQIRSCTVARNSVGLDGDGGGVYVRDSAEPSLEISRSIFWYNSPDAIYALNATPAVEYSDLQGDTVWPGTGNLNYHPLFCDPDAGEFHLGVNSQCNDYPLPGEYIGALGPQCDSVAIIYGVVSESGTGDPIQNASVGAACYNLPPKYALTGADGYYELVIVSGGTDTADVEFSHPAYQDTVIDSTQFATGYSTELNVAMEPGGCNYLPGDCNHNGSPLELNDVTTMIGTYRGTLPPQFECTCPPNGEYFQATADPNGNCVANELSDVTTEIAAYRGTGTVSGCVDCPGTSGMLSVHENRPGFPPPLKARAVGRARRSSD
jgi:predicted outer membrane repeat protein